MCRTIKATKVSHFCGTPSIILGSEESCLNFAQDIRRTKEKTGFHPHSSLANTPLLGAVQRWHVWAFSDEWQQSSHFLSCPTICRLHILQNINVSNFLFESIFLCVLLRVFFFFLLEFCYCSLFVWVIAVQHHVPHHTAEIDVHTPGPS